MLSVYEHKRCGVFFVATGEKFRNEALVSARFIKQLHPSLSITIATDQPIDDSAIDELLLIENPSFSIGDKHRNLSRSPYDITLYLDTDTLVCRPLDPLFELANHYDLAATLANNIHRQPMNFDCPQGAPEINSGVMVYQKNEAIATLFRTWESYYLRTSAELNSKFDQPALQAALHHTPVRLAVLPPAYNFFPSFLRSYSGPITILHSPHSRLLHNLAAGSLEEARDKANVSTGFRIFWPKVGVIPCRNSGEVSRETFLWLLPKMILWFLKAKMRSWRNRGKQSKG